MLREEALEPLVFYQAIEQAAEQVIVMIRRRCCRRRRVTTYDCHASQKLLARERFAAVCPPVGKHAELVDARKASSHSGIENAGLYLAERDHSLRAVRSAQLGFNLARTPKRNTELGQRSAHNE